MHTLIFFSLLYWKVEVEFPAVIPPGPPEGGGEGGAGAGPRHQGCREGKGQGGTPASTRPLPHFKTRGCWSVRSGLSEGPEGAVHKWWWGDQTDALVFLPVMTLGEGS